MLEVLISGKLIRDPQTRQGKSGQSFTTALVRVAVDKGEDSIVASVIAFRDQAEKLGRLRAGDAVSVSGSAKLSTWQKDGNNRTGLDVTATGILSAYEMRKRKGTGESTGEAAPRSKGTSKAGGGERRTGSGGTGSWDAYAQPDNGAPFDDPLGF
jgi:single-stranded DNA-binding protein